MDSMSAHCMGGVPIESRHNCVACRELDWLLASIQSAGVASEVSAQARKHASEKSSPAMKPRADITRSPKQR